MTLGDDLMQSYACGHISTEDSHELIAELDDALSDETFAFYPGVAYRHILVVSRHAELLDASYTPPHDISDKPYAPHLPSGPGSELLLDLMERARPILAASETNRRRVVRRASFPPRTCGRSGRASRLRGSCRSRHVTVPAQR